VLPLCEELEIGFVPWSPLGAGYLTGKVSATQMFEPTDFRANSPRFTPEAMAANQRLVELIKTVADSKGATPAQIALAWLLARKPFIAPIFGTRRLERVRENLGAAAVRLTPDDIAQIESGVSDIEVVGERLPAAILQLSLDGGVTSAYWYGELAQP
jgi:aryl-alcohol dehydrogenase-like predicted oxidoreductase